MLKKFMLAILFALALITQALAFNLGEPVINNNRDWTILIYMDGDNNLEQWALTDLKELEDGIAQTNNKVDVLVLLDRAKGYSNKFGDWTGAKIFHVKPSPASQSSSNKDAISSEILADLGELNMGDPKILETFINDGIKKFPAKRYALVMWDHGAGWVNMANDNDAPGTAKGSDEILLNELKIALQNTRHLFNNNKLDLIAFDMCLMGQADVIATCAEFARYMTAGATTLPAVGMDYLAALKIFAQDLETQEIVKRLVPAANNGFLNINWTTASLTAFDLSKSQKFIDACKNLFNKIALIADNSWGDLTRAIFYSLNYISASDYRNKGYALSSIDFQDFLRRIKNFNLNLNNEIKDLEQAISELILNTQAGPDLPLCKGLSIYAPLRSENMRADYADNDFNKLTGWSNALNKIYAMQNLHAKAAPKIKSIKIGSPVLKLGVSKAKSGADYDIIERDTFMPLSGSGFSGSDRSYIKVDIDGVNILYAYGGFAFSDKADGDYIIYFQQLLPAENMSEGDASQNGTPIFKDGRSELMYQFAGTYYEFSNKMQRTPLMVKAVDIANPNVLTTEGVYTDPALNNQEIKVILKFDAEFFNLISFMGYIEAGGKTIPVPLVPSGKGTFRAKLLRIDSKGKISEVLGQPINFNDDLAVTINLLQPNLYMRALAWAESLGGTGGISASKPVKAAANPAVTPLFNANKNLNLNNLLAGRWAVAVPAADVTGSSGYIMAPAGIILEFKNYNKLNGLYDALLNKPDLNNKNGESLILKANLQAQGLPVLRLVTPKANNKGFNLEDINYALFYNNFWRLINPNNGGITHLIKLNNLNLNLNGEWLGVYDKNIKFKFEGKNLISSLIQGEAEYELVDNRIFIKLKDGRRDIIFALYDEADKILVLSFSDAQGNLKAVKLQNASLKKRPKALEIFN